MSRLSVNLVDSVIDFQQLQKIGTLAILAFGVIKFNEFDVQFPSWATP